METDFLYLNDSCLQFSYFFIGNSSQIKIVIKLRQEVSFHATSTLVSHNDHMMSSWRHWMEIIPRYWPFCQMNPTITGGFPSQRPMSLSFDKYFDLHLNKRLSKQSRQWWFETPSCSLWHHCNCNGKSIVSCPASANSVLKWTPGNIWRTADCCKSQYF